MGAKTWTNADCKTGSRKPERRAALLAACIAVSLLLLCRSQLFSNQHARSLCEVTNCTLSARLRGSQQLLQQAARVGFPAGAQELLGQLGADGDAAGEPSGDGGQAAAGEQQQAEKEEDEERGSRELPLPDSTQEPAAAADDGASQGGDGEQAAADEGAQEPALPEQQELRKNSAAAEEGGRTAAPSPYQLALEDCADLRCLAAAAALERHPAQFRFPHFFIVGWQKCATTSLFHHLKDHPQILAASKKEPEFFSNDCGYNPGECSKADQQRYIHKTMRLGDALEGGLSAAAVEASTHYGKNGRALAGPLASLFPWLKVVVSMREPISQALSMAAHLLDKHDQGCLTRNGAYRCLDKALREGGYAEALQAWLEAFPTEQIYLIQYENITASDRQETVLRSIKGWLGIDPELPHSELGIKNTREYHLMRKGELEEGEQAKGWPMKRSQYEALVALVRADAEKVAELATRHGLADGAEWMRNWEGEWQMTLEHRCKSDGSCTVHPN